MHSALTRLRVLDIWQVARRKRPVPIFLFAAISFFVLSSANSGRLQATSARPGQQNPESAIQTRTVEYESSGAKIEAFLAEPRTAGKHPGVVVIHDNQGLVEPVRQMVRELAAAGYVALAPDLLPRAKSAKSQAPIMGRVLSVDPTVGDTEAAFAYLQKDPDVDPSKISTIGFGWGGWRAFMLAVSEPELYRAVVYCSSPPEQGFAKIHAPVLAQFAQFDFRVTGNALWTDNSMKAAGKQFTYYVYPKVFRDFFNTRSPDYNSDAAKLAWARTLRFLRAS